MNAHQASIEQLVDRARTLARGRRRTLIGIVGPPGAGKSTLAEALAEQLPAPLVPMDGFHLAQTVLEDLGRADRKGAPDTFDAAGYVALLQRLRDPGNETVYAPRFHRDIEEPVANSIPVPPEARIVLTEGNYLLVDDGPWAQVRELLDEAWFLTPPEDVRLERLIARHVAFGRDPQHAWEWAMRTDQPNAELVATTAVRADLVLKLG